jgi:RNA polymerase sigma-70 factor, ECF subfamily
MTIMERPIGVDEASLINSARQGDEVAYRELVDSHRRELHAHCYRMLASLDEADDAVQETLFRAWRGLASFEGRSSVRTWLFKIATNTAIDASKKRSRREFPIDFRPPSTYVDTPGAPAGETCWLEPYPDRFLGVADGVATPEARYEARESLEVAFVAALQHIPANQRAVLILRDVLGYSAAETAELLDTSTAAVNSSLQRARSTSETLLPEQSQQVTLRAIGDDSLRALAERYSDAIERSDIDGLLSMLTEDATWSMPPDTTWFRGLDDIRKFHEHDVSAERWRHLTTSANGQLAIAGYIFKEDRGCFVGLVIDVLTLKGDQISDVVGFLTSDDPESRFTTAEVFPRFELPTELPA